MTPAIGTTLNGSENIGAGPLLGSSGSFPTLLASVVFRRSLTQLYGPAVRCKRNF